MTIERVVREVMADEHADVLREAGRLVVQELMNAEVSELIGAAHGERRPDDVIARGRAFADDFDGPDLDPAVWVPHYLPQWSSRAASAATYALRDSELHLTIPAEQDLWCPDDHDPLRVSGIQSGVFSGEVGSTVGQQPFRDGLTVREAQPAHRGWTPEYGRIEVRARMDLSRRSMASVWVVGLEDEPSRSGEICIFEVFGDAVVVDHGRPVAASVGMGVHPFRDSELTDDFATPRLELDVGALHVYAADWQPGRVEFFVDGEHVRTVDRHRPIRCRSSSRYSTSRTSRGRPRRATTCPSWRWTTFGASPL
jgi:Glycosyl hydrolases family 16